MSNVQCKRSTLVHFTCFYIVYLVLSLMQNIEMNNFLHICQQPLFSSDFWLCIEFHKKKFCSYNFYENQSSVNWSQYIQQITSNTFAFKNYCQYFKENSSDIQILLFFCNNFKKIVAKLTGCYVFFHLTKQRFPQYYYYYFFI